MRTFRKDDPARRVLDPAEFVVATYTGHHCSLLAPSVGDSPIDDFAWQLARTARWNGATSEVISVAQHSVLAAENCPAYPLVALLHDAHETYLGDISSPLKRLLRKLCGVDHLAIIARNIDAAVAGYFGFDPALFESPEVKSTDYRLLATERRDFAGSFRLTVPEGIEPYPFRIKPWSETKARAMFLEMIHSLVTKDD